MASTRFKTAFPWVAIPLTDRQWKDVPFKVHSAHDRQASFNAADLDIGDEVLVVLVAIRREGRGKNPAVLAFHRNRSNFVSNTAPDGTFTCHAWGYDMPELTSAEKTFKVQIKAL